MKDLTLRLAGSVCGASNGIFKSKNVTHKGIIHTKNEILSTFSSSREIASMASRDTSLLLQISSADLAELEDSSVLKDQSKRVADSVEMEKSSV